MISKSRNLLSKINCFSRKREIPISLEKLIKFNQQKPGLFFNKLIKEDLMIRLAKRSKELEALPYGLSTTPSIENTIGWYLNSFDDITNINLRNKNINYETTLKRIYDRHENTISTVTEGIKELKTTLEKRYGHEINTYELDGLSKSLDSFFTNRISVRLLIDHYLQIGNEKNNNYIGVVSKNTDVENIIHNSIIDISDLSSRIYGETPNFKIKKINNNTIPYVPSYLHFVISEIIKNSTKAVLENNNIEPIEIIIGGNKNISIKISDKGNGIPIEDIKKIWEYSYTSSKYNFYSDDCHRYKNSLLISGYGCGLPLRRAIIRFFGGSIKLMSVEGYGTDVYINL